MSDPHFSPSEPVPLRAWRKVQREKGVGDPSRTLLHYSERDFELRRRASNGDRTAAKELAAERTERTEKLELGLGEAELPATTSNAGLPQTGEEDEDIPKGDLGSGTRTYLEGNEGERDG
jgi:hypothetical protein